VLTRALSMAHRWSGRIFFATVDQGVGSATNFLLTILYAAWLPLEGFGHYVILWTIVLFIENVQISLMIDGLPAIVSRCRRSRRERIDIAGAWVALGYGAATSLLLLGAIPIVSLWSPGFTAPIICVAAINPIQRLYIYVRRLSYIRDRQDTAARGSVIYCATMLVGAFALHQFAALSLVSILILWGVGVAAATVTMCAIGTSCLSPSRRATIVWLARNLWGSGRWLVGAAVLFWIGQWGIFPLTAVVGGPDSAGILRALQNLFTPIVQFNAALYLALLPRVADKVVAKGQHYAWTFTVYGTIAFTGIVILYCGFVLIAGERVVALAYHKPEIIASTHMLWPLAAGVVLDSARAAAAMALLAEGRTQPAFVSRVVAVLAFFAAAALLGPLMGVEGLLWANALAHALGTAWQLAAVIPKNSGSRRPFLKPTGSAAMRSPT
jgi:O-antigen/teichoic acid export membrane protein